MMSAVALGARHRSLLGPNGAGGGGGGGGGADGGNGSDDNFSDDESTPLTQDIYNGR